MKRLVTAAAAALLLSGCIGTSGKVYAPNTAPGSKYWYEIDNVARMSVAGEEVLRGTLDSELRAHNLLAAPTDPEAKKVKITITNYYMRPAAARFMVGIMAGRDNVHSVITIHDPATNEQLGRMEVDSKNHTAMGTSNGLIRGHAQEIAGFLTNKKR